MVAKKKTLKKDVHDGHRKDRHVLDSIYPVYNPRQVLIKTKRMSSAAGIKPDVENTPQKNASKKAGPARVVIIRTIRASQAVPAITPVKAKGVNSKQVIIISGKSRATKSGRSLFASESPDMRKVIIKTIRAKKEAEKVEVEVLDESPKNSVESTKKLPDCWSDCGQIFFTGGKAFAIAPNLRTICLGNRADVQGFLDYGKMVKSLAPIQKETLIRIKENKKQLVQAQ